MKPARDNRLDFWRGLCLIDMVLVHLVYEGVYFGKLLNPLFEEYLRFAAGGFIFVAGMSIGAIFLPRAIDPWSRGKTYVGLLRRSGYILLAHYFANISLLLLDAQLGRLDDATPVGLTIWKILTLRAGGDLLLFYVVMVGIAPLLLELLRRGLWWVLVLVSGGLFVIGQFHPDLVTFPLPADELKFHLVLWQAIFVCGLLFGAILPKFDKLTWAARLGVWCAAVCGFAVLFGANYGESLGLPHVLLPISFRKIPLSAGEFMRYISLILVIVVGTDLVWSFIRDGRAVSFVRQLGRKSLAVYVAHLWVVVLVATYGWRMWNVGLRPGWLAIPSILLLWGWAWLMEWNKRRGRAKGSAAASAGLAPVPASHPA